MKTAGNLLGLQALGGGEGRPAGALFGERGGGSGWGQGNLLLGTFCLFGRQESIYCSEKPLQELGESISWPAPDRQTKEAPLCGRT